MEYYYFILCSIFEYVCLCRAVQNKTYGLQCSADNFHLAGNYAFQQSDTIIEPDLFHCYIMLSSIIADRSWTDIINVPVFLSKPTMINESLTNNELVEYSLLCLYFLTLHPSISTTIYFLHQSIHSHQQPTMYTRKERLRTERLIQLKQHFKAIKQL